MYRKSAFVQTCINALYPNGLAGFDRDYTVTLTVEERLCIAPLNSNANPFDIDRLCGGKLFPAFAQQGIETVLLDRCNFPDLFQTDFSAEDIQENLNEELSFLPPNSAAVITQAVCLFTINEVGSKSPESERIIRRVMAIEGIENAVFYFKDGHRDVFAGKGLEVKERETVISSESITELHDFLQGITTIDELLNEFAKVKP